MLSVVFFLPVWEFGLASLAAVRDDPTGPPVAAVGDHRGVTDGGLRVGQFPCLAVVAVAGQGLANGHDEPCVASMTT